MYIANRKTRYLERVIWLLAGLFILIGTVLGYYFSPYWLMLNLLVGVNLIIFAWSGFCIMANILKKLGIQPLCKK